MPYELPPQERAYLRKLAQRQAEIAALPVMRERAEMWIRHNDHVPGARAPVIIETWTFDRDFMPESIYQCATPLGRQLERQMLRHIRQHELIDDDHVCPDTFDMGWHVSIKDFPGLKLDVETVKDSEGVELGYHAEAAITDLNEGFDHVKPSTFSVDRDDTMAFKSFMEELLGDLLPVVIRSGTFGNNMLTYRIMRLMSMETFYMAMYDAPEQLHALMAQLRDDALHISKWAEMEGLLTLNNGNAGSYAILAPGTIDENNDGAHIIGTLTVGSSAQTNNVTLGNFSRFRATLGPAMKNDKLDVFGTVTIAANTTLEVKGADKAKSGVHTLIRAENGLLGQHFANVLVDGVPDARYVRYTANEVQYVLPSKGAMFMLK